MLLGVYLGNGLSDNGRFPHKYCVIDGILTSCYNGFSNPVRDILYRLAGYSLLARVILREFRQHLLRDESSSPQEAPKQTPVSQTPRQAQSTPATHKGKGLPLLRQPAEAAPKPVLPVIRGGRSAARLYSFECNDIYQRGFDLMKENILLLHEDTKARGTQLVVVIIPPESQIYDWRGIQYVAERGLNSADYDRFCVVRLLTEFLDRCQVPYVNLSLNLLPELRKAARTDRELHPNRWHWSVAADQLAADVVGDYLTARFDYPVKQEVMGQQQAGSTDQENSIWVSSLSKEPPDLLTVAWRKRTAILTGDSSRNKTP